MGKIWEAGGQRYRGTRTQLYRHFDASDQLLYVGISLSVMNRLAQHRSTSEWFGAITKVTVETFDTREEALYAESIAIAREGPKHNRQGISLRIVSESELKELANMRRFDPEGSCPKCGSDDLFLAWIPQSGKRKTHGDWRDNSESREHLRSVCNECEFKWNEAPLDSAEDAA